MSTLILEDDYKERRRKWLNRLGDELEKAGSLLSLKSLISETSGPQWVDNITRLLEPVIIPAVKLKRDDYSMTPERVGALIGHMCGLAVWLMEWTEVALVAAAKGQPRPPAELMNSLMEEAPSSLSEGYTAMRRLAKLALCSCVDQTYEDMTSFLGGLADGFGRKPKTSNVGEIGNLNFEVYVLMLLLWRPIGELNSVRELRELLEKCLGARVGSQKRIEKICERIGLTFRKPGRPRKK